MKVEEIIKSVRIKSQAYSEARIYYALRQMHIRYITSTQVKAIQTFLAFVDLGQPYITTTLFSAITDMPTGNALTLLHRLGDKRVIYLIREDSSATLPYRFALTETFLKHFRQ